MNAFLNEYQYIAAWAVYAVAGFAFGASWWRLTRRVDHSGWRELLRGIVVVVIFTPWYISEVHEALAPAIVVVLMDFLLGSSDNGLTGSLVLLMATAGMLVLIIVRRLLKGRKEVGA
ncbi:MAG: hypothetical protein ACI8Z1_001077 [Candidatus Azotimanducaceae bacterium]|jgi:hypothetical protein